MHQRARGPDELGTLRGLGSRGRAPAGRAELPADLELRSTRQAVHRRDVLAAVRTERDRRARRERFVARVRQRSPASGSHAPNAGRRRRSPQRRGVSTATGAGLRGAAARRLRAGGCGGRRTGDGGGGRRGCRAAASSAILRRVRSPGCATPPATARRSRRANCLNALGSGFGARQLACAALAHLIVDDQIVACARRAARVSVIS